MAKPRIAVIGLGEVGSAVYKIAVESGAVEAYGYDVDESRSVNRLEEIPSPLDYLHIAIPYKSASQFAEAVAYYAERLKPGMIIVHSTVAPGTTRMLYARLGVPVAYTPVRGKHPCIERHLRFWPKWVAALPSEKLDEAAAHLSSLGLPVKPCRCEPETLELAKLWETVYRAAMIAAWQELHRMALRFGADVGRIAEFIAEVHEVLRDRPVYYPGVIGGHCLIPNTEILRSVYDSRLLDFILESNRLRSEEIHDPRVAEGVEAVRRVAEGLVNREYYECR